MSKTENSGLVKYVMDVLDSLLIPHCPTDLIHYQLNCEQKLNGKMYQGASKPWKIDTIQDKQNLILYVHQNNRLSSWSNAALHCITNAGQPSLT